MNMHPINRLLCSARISLATLLAMTGMALILSAPLAQAKEKTAGDEHWGEWKAMGDGYVARRRQPARLDLPRAERRQANVQERLQKLLAKQARLQAKLGTAKGKRARQIQKKLVNLDKRIARLSNTQNSLASTLNIQIQKKALWLHTAEEGLYSVTIADLAVNMGRNETLLRDKARTGLLVLTTGKNLKSVVAGRAVSWNYDEVTDRILFAGEAYDTFYSAENAYKFRLGGKNSKLAQPMAVAEGAATEAFGSETAFRETLKFEEEPDLLYSTWSVASEPDADYWFWDYLYGSYKEAIDVNLNIPDPDSTGTAQLRVTLRGWTDLDTGNEHEVSAELNGTPVGTSVVWDGFQQAVLVADFDQSILSSSSNNSLTLRNSYAAGTNPGQWLDQVEVDYQRMPVASNGKLWMHNVVAGTQTVSGFASEDITVIESPDGTATLRKDVRIEPDGLGGWSVTFDVAGDADFLLSEQAASAVASITADNSANLKNRSNRADYLVIAPRDFSETANGLAAYRSSRYSNVKVVWLDDIYNEFSAGHEDPIALSRFMSRVVKRWSIVPDTVVLAGKGSLDQKDRMGYTDGFLPVVMTATPWALAASDSRLLGFEDNAPFTVGRLPITNDAEGVAYLAKLSAYESTTPGSEKFNAVLVADNPDDAGDFHTNSDQQAERLLGSLGFSSVTKLYHPDIDVRTSLIDSATWETGYVSYDGHGSTAQVGDYREKFITATDAGALTNTAYPIFTALTCAAGDDTLPGTRSLSGALVLNPAGGAIAAVAPTGLSLDADAQLLGNALVDSLFNGSSTVGQSLKAAKAATSGSISDFMPRMYSVVGEPGVYAR